VADIEMPQLGETVTEGTITRWFKQVGDPIGQDEVLFEVSTDKVDSEVPSPEAGYLLEIKVPEGDTVDVGTVLAVLGDSPPDGSGASGDEGDTADSGGDDGEEAKQEEPAEEEAPAEEPASVDAEPEQQATEDGGDQSAPAPAASGG
jgi:pyruvate dehydrogenase E2 component (dihydrolipoamide acetyltransferase)